MRSLTFFFKKPYPFSIKSRYKPHPEYKEYHKNKLLLLIGGNEQKEGELAERLIMANSLLDQAQIMFLTGELALLILHILGFPVGKVERTGNNTADYDNLKEFVLQFLQNSVDKGVRLELPTDFKVTPFVEFEDSVKEPEQDPEAANTSSQMNKTNQNQTSQQQLS